MPSYPSCAGPRWTSLFLYISTQSTELVVHGRREEGRSAKRQVRISKGIKGTQLLLTALKISAETPLMSPQVYLTGGSPHGICRHPQPPPLSKPTPLPALQPYKFIFGSSGRQGSNLILMVIQVFQHHLLKRLSLANEQIKYLNIRPRTINLPGDKIGAKLLNTHLGYDFFGHDTKNTCNKSKKSISGTISNL